MKTRSFLRREEYTRLSKLSIDGNILDVGGSKKSGYHELIGGAHTITTGNIDASYGADIIFDAEQSWPFPGASFDGVLLVNLLEHLYHYENALAEAARVLKGGGTVAGVVPFMFSVHGSPNDYFRYTRSALEHLLADRGFSGVRIEELGTGAGSVIYHCLIGFARFDWLADLGIACARGFDGLIRAVKPDNMLSARHMPLGYYFEARRK